MDALQQIKEPIKQEMESYKRLFDSFLVHSNPLLQEVLMRIGGHKGKMMRPALTLLAAKLFAPVNENTISTAATFEFFHTATLVHDDVVDESEERRGVKSVNEAYSSKVAVLVGDYLLSRALLNASRANSPELVRIVSDAAGRLANGELLQLNNVNVQEISEDTYFSIIKDKTAALFAACAEAGALSVNADEMDVKALKTYGEIVGICFQIRDDIFDYVGGDEIGKPTGNDMKEGKLTLPVIHALLSAGTEEMFGIAYKVKLGSVEQEEVDRLVQFTIDNGGLEYARSVMCDYAARAKSLLEKYPDSDVKNALCRFVDYTVDRSF